MIPPHDATAEAAVLNTALAIRGAAGVLVGSVVADDFFVGTHCKLWAAIEALVARGRQPDDTAIVAHLRDTGSMAVAEATTAIARIMADAPLAIDAAQYVAIVRGKAQLRRIIRTCQEIAAEGYQPIEDPTAFAEAAEVRLLAATTSQTDSDFTTYADAVARVHDAIKARSDSKAAALPSTGFADLDKLLVGWQPGRLYVLAARPGVGKSALAANFAMFRAKCERTHAAFFTLEMSDEELAMRAIAAESSVNTLLLQGMGKPLGHESARIDDARRSARNVRLHFADDPGVTVGRIRAMVRRLQQRVERSGDKLGLVVVDYLQLVASHGKGAQNREREVAEISRGLKRLAKEARVPVLALSQLNRESAKGGGRPGLHELRESGAIEQDADVVMLIHPVANSADAHHEVVVAKCRGGAPGVATLRFVKEYTRFENT